MVRSSERYDRAFVATRAIVNEHDLIALLEMGAPEDEYDPEVTDLVRLVLREEPIDEEAVDEVWVRWFGDNYRMSGTDALASLTNDLRSLQTEFRASLP